MHKVVDKAVAHLFYGMYTLSITLPVITEAVLGYLLSPPEHWLPRMLTGRSMRCKIK